MRSTPGCCASIVFLLALPLTALYARVFPSGAEVVIHGALALGCVFMAFAVRDFKVPGWATWMGIISMTALATIFSIQGVSELVQNESLTYWVYQVLGQSVEGWLVRFFMAWCVVVLVVDQQATSRALGIVAMVIVASLSAYELCLAYQETSLNAQAPGLKLLMLTPFIWLLTESAKDVRPRSKMVADQQ